MGSFHKDKSDGKYYCDYCHKEFTLKELMQPYNYFGSTEDDPNEHYCKEVKK